jgi:hypothetical protein
VLLTFLMMIIQIVGCILSFRQSSVLLATPSNSTVPAVPTTPFPGALPSIPPTVGCAHAHMIIAFLFLELVLAFVNIGLAVYVQRQTWEGLQDIVDMEQTEARATGQQVRKRNVATLILDSAQNIFCYDVCFCFYFFLLIVELGLGVYGASLTSTLGCNPSGWPATVMYMGLAYPICIAVWSICWVVLLHFHSCMEDCCKPFGGSGFNCCFGRRPEARTGRDPFDSDDEEAPAQPQQVVMGQVIGGRQAQPPPSRKCCCCCIPVPHF